MPIYCTKVPSIKTYYKYLYKRMPWYVYIVSF